MGLTGENSREGAIATSGFVILCILAHVAAVAYCFCFHMHAYISAEYGQRMCTMFGPVVSWYARHMHRTCTAHAPCVEHFPVFPFPRSLILAPLLLSFCPLHIYMLFHACAAWLVEMCSFFSAWPAWCCGAPKVPRYLAHTPESRLPGPSAL